MKWLDSLSPARLAALGGVGSLLVLLSLVSATVNNPEHHRPGASFWIVVALGYALMLLCENRFARGIATQRWPEARLDALRRVLSHWAWNAALFAFWLAGIIDVIVSRTSRFGALFTMGLLAYLYVTRLNARLRISQNGPPRTNWSDAAPLRSEHWGERRLQANPEPLSHSPRV